jgi:hypothetical protein
MKLYKTTFIIEVVGEEPLTDVSLSDIDYAITEGHYSGVFRDTRVQELTEYQAAQELIFQGSDVNFLLPDWEPCPHPLCVCGCVRIKKIKNRQAVDSEIKCPVCQGVAMISPETKEAWKEKAVPLVSEVDDR